MANLLVSIGTVLWMILLHYIGFFDLGVVVYGLWGSLILIPVYFILRVLIHIFTVPAFFCMGLAEGVWQGVVMKEEESNG